MGRKVSERVTDKENSKMILNAGVKKASAFLCLGIYDEGTDDFEINDFEDEIAKEKGGVSRCRKFSE